MAKVDAQRAEHRWPAAIAIVVALGLYALLPSVFFPVLRYIVVAVGLALLVPVLAVNPVRLHHQTRWSRWLSVGQTLLLLLANQVALVQLVILLVSDRQDGPSLLVAAVQVWGTNIIAFALLYWELDRGGPVDRTQVSRDQLPHADFRFPQDEDHDAAPEVAARSSVKLNWTPSFVDYLYVSATNSMAFGPADAMPLSHRVKALMGFQAIAGFVILALVIARAVSLLG